MFLGVNTLRRKQFVSFYQILRSVAKNRLRIIEVGAHFCLRMRCKGKSVKFSRIVIKKKTGTEESEAYSGEKKSGGH